MNAEGAAANVMVGIGETYLPAFVLALTSSQLACGLVSSIPILVGSVLQLISPYAVRRIGSYRRWVVLCAAVQAVGFLPLALAATASDAPVLPVFALAALYWGAGMGGGPAWNVWVGTLVPRRLWPKYFSWRTRYSQLGLLLGFAGGGTVLQLGVQHHHPVAAFAVLFFIAAMSRMCSAGLLASQRELSPPGRELGTWKLAGLVQTLREGSQPRVLAFLLAAQVAVQISAAYFNPYMLGQLRFSYVQYMVLLSVAMLVKAAVLPLMGRIAARWGATRLLWISGIAIMPLPAMWLVSDHFAYLFGLQTYSGVAWAGYELATMLLFFETIPTEKRLGVLTVFNVANSAAIVLGTVMGAAMLTSMGAARETYHAIFVSSTLARGAALFLLVGVPHLALARARLAIRPGPGTVERPILITVHSPCDSPAQGLPAPHRRKSGVFVPADPLADTLPMERQEIGG
jgi:MFS family permease